MRPLLKSYSNIRLIYKILYSPCQIQAEGVVYPHTNTLYHLDNLDVITHG